MASTTEENKHRLLGGRYEIIRRVGSGGMAYVLRARDLNLQREVAIKVMRTNLVQQSEFRARFLQEARAAANLSHPNIVTIHDFGQDGDRFFIVMEYVEGTDLKTLIHDQGRFPMNDALSYMMQICNGVGYAHRAGLVHCDLKPQNILVAEDGRVKITDFGIAVTLATVQPESTQDLVWGSPHYFAPEQIMGASPSPATDVYALGVVLFEMLTGRLPFEADDLMLLAELHSTVSPPSPLEFVPDLPPAIGQIILKVLSKEPAARYRTADQLGRVLATFIEQSVQFGETAQHAPSAIPVEADTVPVVAGPAPFRRVDYVAVVLGLLAFIAVGGLIPLWLWACMLYPSCPLLLR
ncbi:MAG TPA: serine/threonine protein kinase [Anaerolineae bacterium]|nr:serine/threonine protein kinase [Anaerolineae bacterium]